MSGPNSKDHELAHLWQRLIGAAALPDGPRRALPDIARFLRADQALLLNSAPSAAVGAPGEVLAFDHGTEDGRLRQVLDASGADHGLCAVLRLSGSAATALVVVRGKEAFGDTEVSWLQLLTPHICLAMDLAGSLNSPFVTVHAAGNITHLLPTPCLLTDEAGRCLERNAGFEKVLEALRGSIRAGRVVFHDPFLEGSWRQALSEAHATAQAQSLLASAAQRSSWKVHVVPVPCLGRFGDHTPRWLMLVFFERVAGAPAQARTLQSSRPLTKAELEVLASLQLGHTAKVIARARGASVHTVRSQITSILGKTGHHTQKELIASLGASSFDGVISDAEEEDA